MLLLRDALAADRARTPLLLEHAVARDRRLGRRDGDGVTTLTGTLLEQARLLQVLDRRRARSDALRCAGDRDRSPHEGDGEGRDRDPSHERFEELALARCDLPLADHVHHRDLRLCTHLASALGGPWRWSVAPGLQTGSSRQSTMDDVLGGHEPCLNALGARAEGRPRASLSPRTTRPSGRVRR